MEVTFIIPIVKYNNIIKKALTNFLKTLNQKAVIVASEDAVEKIEKTIIAPLEVENVKVIGSKADNIYDMINASVDYCDDDLVTVIDVEKEFSLNWIYAAEPYVSARKDVSVFLPLVLITKNDEIIGFGNESMWSPVFTKVTQANMGQTDLLGVVSKDSLETLLTYYTNGIIIKKDVLGALKLDSSCYDMAWYEFMCHAIFNGVKVFVVPKFSSSHDISNLEPTDKDYTPIIDSIRNKYLTDTEEDTEIAE